jgi:hypothetical protein
MFTHTTVAAAGSARRLNQRNPCGDVASRAGVLRIRMSTAISAPRPTAAAKQAWMPARAYTASPSGGPAAKESAVARK